MDDSGKNSLLNSILEKSHLEVERIKQASNENIAFKLERTQKQVVDIMTAAQSYAELQVDQIKRTALSNRTMEERKAMLDCNEQLNSLAIKKMFAKLNDAMQTIEYQSILLSFLVEGTLALSSDQLVVNSSQAERRLLTESFFSYAECEVLRLSGRRVSYLLDSSPPLLAQGIIVKSADGLMLYNNSINSRFMRYQDSIKVAIAKKLSSQENSQSWNG